MNRSHNYPQGLSRAAGLSLIELMIAIVVALILVAGLIQVYLSNKQSYNAQEQLSRMQENGRFAMDLITSDLRRAGYWGGAVDLTRIERGTPGAQEPAATCDSADAEDSWGRMVRWRISGLFRTNSGYENCADGYSNRQQSDILTIRYASAIPVDPAATLEPAKIYFRTNTDSGSIIMGDSDLDAVANRPITLSGNDLSVFVLPVVSHAYYIADGEQVCPDGEPIPELRRITLSATTGKPEAQPIARGVEQFQARYLIGDRYWHAGQITGDQWLNVRAVRVWLLVRGDCPETSLQNNTTYTLGGVDFPFNDQFRRQMYVSTIMLRNTVINDPNAGPGMPEDEDDPPGEEETGG